MFILTRKNRKKTGGAKLWIVLLIAVVSAGAFVLYSREGRAAKALAAPAAEGPEAPAAPAAFVRVQVVSADQIVRESIVQNMSIEAVDRVQMTPRVTGRLLQLHVKQGDIVKRGQLIATLEHAQQDALIGSTEAQLASAKADSERARAEMMNAKTNLDRYERLLKEGFSTQQQYDTVQTEYVSARASYNAAQAKERQAAAELGRVRSTKMDYIMNSPLDGTVLNDYSLTPGTMISPSSPIADIADLRRLKASLRIPELKIFAVNPGMAVFLRFDALPDEEFRGLVSLVDPYVDPATRSSAVEIKLDNEATGNRLRPGMFGQASIVEREFRDAILLPAGALQSSDDGFYVLLEVDGVARRRAVKTGIRQGNAMQITDGLKPGERVIVFGGSNLNDGDPVSVQ